MQEFIFALFSLLTSPEPASAMGQCDPREGPRVNWSQELRKETRKRVRNVCRNLRASPITCAYLDAVVVRESSGRASVRHTKGKGEDGLGPMGLSLKWHADKWPGKDEDPMFCQPEVSALVALAIMYRAVSRFGARNMVEVQAIYGGSWECWPDYDGNRTCVVVVKPRHQKSICGRLSQRGFSCRAPITREDLGRPIPRYRRRKVARSLVEEYDARQRTGS